MLGISRMRAVQVLKWELSGRVGFGCWIVGLGIGCRATENRFFAGSDRFLVCKTDSVCIKRIFFGPKKTHFADHKLYWPNFLD